MILICNNDYYHNYEIHLLSFSFFLFTKVNTIDLSVNKLALLICAVFNNTTNVWCLCLHLIQVEIIEISFSFLIRIRFIISFACWNNAHSYLHNLIKREDSIRRMEFLINCTAITIDLIRREINTNFLKDKRIMRKTYSGYNEKVRYRWTEAQSDYKKCKTIQRKE